MIEGVQQPYEVQVITGIDNAKNLSLLLSTYPNPTTDFLTLHVEDVASTTLHFQLVNMNGQILRDQPISNKESVISFLDLSSSIYFLKVLDNQDLVKTFKIIKN